MKKLFLVLAVAALSFSTAIAQDATAAPADEATVENVEATAEAAAEEAIDPEVQIAGD